MAQDNVEEAVGQERNALLVLGMHRSGTSATTRVLNLLGAELGESLMGPGQSNDLGFWEHMDAYQINDRLLHELGMSWDDPRPMPDRWEERPQTARALREIVQILRRDFSKASLWAVKDPRVCRLVPLWRKALEQQHVFGRAVIVLRHPDEIAGSLAVRNGLSRSQVHLLWARHMCEAEHATRGMPRCVIRYDSLLQDWRKELAKASASLLMPWPVNYDDASQQIEDFLSHGSRHHVAEHKASDSQASWVDAAYNAFGAIPDNGDWGEASALVDEFERAASVCDGYFLQTAAKLDEFEISRAKFDDTSTLLEASKTSTAAALVEFQARLQADISSMFLESESQKQAHLEASLAASEGRAVLALLEASKTSTAAALVEFQARLQADISSMFLESESQKQAHLEASLAASEGRAVLALTSMLVESEAKVKAEVLSASENDHNAVIVRLQELLACVQEEVRIRNEREHDLVRMRAQETAAATERTNALSSQIDTLKLMVKDRSEELDAAHAEAARLRMQLEVSRLEVQRQQRAFFSTSAELNKCLEAMTAYSFSQAGFIRAKEQEIAALGGALEASKQSLDSALELADSLSANLIDASRPWYKRMRLGGNAKELKEAR